MRVIWAGISAAAVAQASYIPPDAPVADHAYSLTRPALHRPDAQEVRALMEAHPSVKDHVRMLRSGASAAYVVNSTCSASAPGACNAAITLALQGCAGASQCDITLSSGVFALHTAPYGTQVYAGGMSGLTISGPGAALLLDDISSTFVVDNCSQVTLADFQLDMVRQPYTYGQVTSVHADGSVDVAIDESVYAVNTTRWPWLTGAQGVMCFDPVNMRPCIDALDIYALTSPLPVSYPVPGTMRVSLPVGAASVGEALVVRHQTYAFNGITAIMGAALTVRNVTLFSTAGMGVVAEGTTGVTLDGVSVLRRDGRPMSITADGAHFTSCRGGDVLLQNCVFEGQGDDALNVPSMFQDIESMSGTTLQLGKDGTVAEAIGNPGDTVQFLARESFALHGTATLVSKSANNTVVFDHIPTGAARWDLTLNLASSPNSVTLLNNTFRNNRARGTLLKAFNVHVEGNSYEYNSGPAAQVAPDGCYWFEGHSVANWTFVNNIVTGCNYGPAQLNGDIYLASCAPYFSNGVPTTNGYIVSNAQLHFNVTIQSNTFTQDRGENAVMFYGVKGLMVTGNTVKYEQGAPLPPADFNCTGCLETSSSANVCPGRPSSQCVTSGV